ncbi:hypothetical protein F444_15620 [Phytophthora nicotianae P1976]|uniref:C2H2-type domain-containing protein n=1 Tax=Phytophthora nicotianae P1976 TaxID=1317066 RepID=A0A080ZLB9_PHYNI|nr:hypothetical protein F444_15620 [Phytophthora nicotianae P1976]
MATEEADSNPPGLVAAQRPLQELFPVRRVLGMLQRNERLSEQPAPPKPHTQHQENQNVNKQTASIQNEEIVSESPPSQPSEDSQELNPDKGGNTGEVLCPKCGKGFSSNTSLRTHLANVYPCNEPRPATLPREGRFESKTCFKCGKTFASWQGLRGHLNRIRPCDQEKPVPVTTQRRRPAASRTCVKCGKTFSSPQSLRIHMNRVKPCDQDLSAPSTPPATTSPSTPLMMNTEDMKKEAERKAKARYQARKAYLKKRGRLDELGDPPSSFNHSSLNHKVEDTVPKPDLKRHPSDAPSQDGDNVESPNSGAKKQRVQEELPQEVEPATSDSPSDVSRLATEPSIPAPANPEPPQKTVTTEGSFVHRSNTDHGGDLLAGGCSCPPCVRRWARKLMNRMQQLEDEVVMLRQKESAGSDSTTVSGSVTNTLVVSDSPAQSAVTHSLLSEKTVDTVANLSNLSQAKPSSIAASPEERSHTDDQQSLTATDLLDSDKESLLDAYTHMNDQILTNEKVIEESTGHAQFLVGCNPDFRRQVDELRVSISTEKSKREITVAALIAREWKPQLDEFKRALLNQTERGLSPLDEQPFHEKWSQISSQISAKDKVISVLEKRMDSLGESSGSQRSRYAEMGELSSKMAAEYAAKMALEGEREGVYDGLVRSSYRIRSLVKNALL